MKTVKFLWAGMLALAAAGLGLGGAPARADVITFDVSGTMTPTLNAACSPTCTLGGDIVFDNSAGAPHMLFRSAPVNQTVNLLALARASLTQCPDSAPCSLRC
jgi:hypothetical protein